METLLRAKKGYSADIEKLFKTSYPQVYYVCLILTNSSEKAAAICVELYKKVFATLDRFSDDTDFTAWMKNAAVVASISVLKKNNPYLLRHVGTSNIEKLEVEDNRPLTTEQTARVLENCLKRLDFPARMAAVCYYFNGMTRAQLCRITDLDDSEIDTVLSRAADSISNLSSELHGKGVIATRIDPKALLELLCLEERLPGIDPKTLYVPIEPIEEFVADKEKKSGVKISVAAYVAVTVAVLVAGTVTAWKSGLFGGNKVNSSSVASLTSSEFVASQISSTEVTSIQSMVESEKETSKTASSKVASASSKNSSSKDTKSKASSSAVKEIKPAVKPPQPLYLFTRAEYYNAAGEKDRVQQWVYSGGRIKTMQTKTTIFTETLNYVWTKNGRKCTVTNSNGTVVEKVEYDVNGNPTKRVFTNGTVNFKWSYKYNKKGLIETANYKSTTNGSYAYTYDDNNRIKTQKHSVDGSVYTTNYTYYDDGMISTRTETDFDGSQLLYDYVYNYDEMTYTITCSDGSREQGVLAQNR